MLRTDFSRFSATATSYDFENAVILAEASALAYQNEDQIRDAIAQKWRITSEKDVYYLDKREENRLIFSGRFDTQAFIVKTAQAIIISFRGTEPNNRNDWKTDLNFRRHIVPIANSPKRVRVHKGFWFALNLVWEELLDHLQTLRTNDQRIWLTGHSLGGALACLAAFRLSQLPGMDFSGLYTYGQPRAGGWDFANRFNMSHGDRIFRFVNNNDFVTFVPPFLFRYGHVGTLYYLTAKRRLVVNGLPFSRAIFDRISGFRDFGQLDHSLETYINILSENKPT